MKRIVAKLLTWWIPIKKYRKALRGILNIGVRKYIKIIKTDKTKKFDYELAICAIMKNEGPYLKEWLDYHILVGVDKFYLYDNESTDDTKDVIQPYIEKGIVDCIRFPGVAVQDLAYIDSINKHANETKYMAIIDLDEFLVPVKHNNLKDFLNSLPYFSALVITWVVYGSSDKLKKEKGLVMERFKRHTNKMWGVKSIVNPRLVIDVTNPHTFDIAGYYIDEHANKLGFIDQTNNPPSCDLIRCNHYATKSYEEMMARCAKGSAAGNVAAKADAQKRFEKHNRNEVYDDIMDKYIDVLKGIKNEL